MEVPKDTDEFLDETKNEVRNYLDVKSELIRLQLTEKAALSAGVITSTLLIAGIAFILFGLLILLSGLILANLLGSTLAGFAVVAGGCLVLLIVALMMRKSWIERPVTNRLIKLLLDKETSHEA